MPEEYPSTPLIQEVSKEEWPSRGFESEAPERPPVTPETKEKMDRELVALGNLMKDSGIWWQLDGALNISLLKGEYIGTHVDVDISVLRNQVPEFEQYLAEHGYGLFLRKRDSTTGDRIFKRVGAKAFERDEKGEWQLRIGAMDEAENINLKADLVSAEVAVVEKNTDGKPLGWGGAVLPEEWLTGETIDFHGTPINLSHPGRFLFNKIWFVRGYDQGDLEEFAKTNALSLDDVDDVEQLVTSVLENLEREKRMDTERAGRIRSRFPWLRELIKKTKKT